MTNKEKNFISAVIYVHNAENRIEAFLRMVMNVLEESFEHSEIICVNDHSDDASLQIIDRIGKEAANTGITIVNMSYFHGVELAMNAGVDLSIGDFVFEFDNTNVDFESSIIMDVYRRALEGYDIVSASADRKSKFTSRLFYRVFDSFTDISYRMSTESFRILSRRVIYRISSMNQTTPYRKAIYINSGLRMDNIKYKPVSADIQNKDKREGSYRIGLAADSLLMFTQFGYRVSFVMTFAMMVISILMLLYSVITYLLFHPVEGWTTTILFLSFAFFGLFAILTIIIKYLQLIVNMVFKRKHYSYESINKISR